MFFFSFHLVKINCVLLYSGSLYMIHSRCLHWTGRIIGNLLFFVCTFALDVVPAIHVV